MTTARSVRSRDCSPETVARRIVSGVSIASRSSTLVEGAADSSEDWISSALAWASVTFCSASSMNFLRTVYQTPYRQHPIHRIETLPGKNHPPTSIVPTLVFWAMFLYWYKPSLAAFPLRKSTHNSTKRIITGSSEAMGVLRVRLEVTCS